MLTGITLLAGSIPQGTLAAPSVTVTAPNGGECLTVGNPYAITWTQGEVDHAAFYFVESASSNPPASGSWTVHPVSGTSWNWTPISSDVTENGKVWIEGHNAAHSRLAIDGSNSTFAVRTECSAPSISNVNVGSITQTSAVVTWSTNESSDSQVEYGTTTSYGSTTSVQQTGGVTSHSVTVSGLTKGTTYHFRVISKDSAGNKTTSSDFSFTTTGSSDSTKPGIIDTLTIKSVSGNSVTLEWVATGDDGSSGTASSYDIRYSTTAITASNWSSRTQATGEPSPASPGTTQSFTVTGLTAETRYYFAIRALDEADNISDLSTSSVTVITGVDTTVPTIDNIVLSDVTETSAKINWTTNESTKHRFDYGTTNSYGSTVSDNTFKTSHSVTLNGLNANTTYHYKITATDANGNSTNSGDRLFTTNVTLTLSLNADRTTVTPGQQVTLTWQASYTGASCTAAGAWSGSKSYSGSQAVTVNSTSEYRLTCTYAGSSVTKSVTVSASGVDISFLKDGDLIRVPTLPGEEGRNVWIVKISPDRTKLYRRLILTPQIFSSYRHLNPSSVKLVSREVRDAFTVSNYVRAYDPNPASYVDDPKVYLLVPDEYGDSGIKRHMDMTGPAFYAKVDPFAVYIINRFERDMYPTGTPISSL